MIRIVVMGVACTVLVWIGLAIWFASDRGQRADRAGEFLEGPTQFNTTGGQEMRPRWGNGEGERDETTGN